MKDAKLLEALVAMLSDESPRKRIAAAVVLGELRVEDAKVIRGLSALAAEPADALAEPAVEALGQLGPAAMPALPALLAALERGGRELSAAAGKTIAAMGEQALPELRSQMESASPQLRAALSQVLPAVGGRKSFELTLAGLYDQPFDAVNRVALTVRQEAREATPAARRVLANQVERFLEKKRTLEQEPALRGALKILGFLALPESVPTLRAFLASRHLPLVRVEATTALRFAAAGAPPRKLVAELISLTEDRESLVARAARDSLTVLGLGAEHVEELGAMARASDEALALWAIGRLAELGEPALPLLGKLAGEARHGRGEAAAKALAQREGGEVALARALVACEDEAAAVTLSSALAPLVARLSKATVKKLLETGLAKLQDSAAVARRQLEPVRLADAKAWAEGLRGALPKFKKDPVRTELVLGMLVRSTQATLDDRLQLALLLLSRSTLDPHPAARRRDPALAELEKLADEGVALDRELAKAKALEDEARYYVGFHLAESAAHRPVGAAILEALAAGKRTKLAKAARNKLALLAEEDG